MHERKSLRHRVAKSEREGNGFYDYESSGMETSAPANPGSACGGMETACCTITRKQNKKERKNQIGKGGPSVDTGGFLFVQDEEIICF